RTVLVLMPYTTGGIADGDRRDPLFYASSSARAAFVAFWGEIARRHAGNPWLIFDIINEPFNTGSQGQAGSDDILALQEQCIAEIRRYDKARICMVECSMDGQPRGYLFMRPVAGGNTVYSVHMYAPCQITHARVDGAAWTDTYPTTTAVAGNLPYLASATKFNKARMLVELEPVIRFQQRYGLPIFVGEFSCTRVTPHPIAPDMVRDYIDTFEALGWSWNYHAFGFPSSPWAPMVLPFSTAPIDVSAGQIALNAATGATNQAWAPIAPVADAMRKNVLFSVGTAPAPPMPIYVAEEDFEVEGTGGLFTSRNGTGGGATLDTQAAANPRAGTGTKHARMVHNNTADSASAQMVLTPEATTTAAAREFYLAFDICMTAPA